MNLKEIKEMLEQADPQRVEGYLNMFDRVLLYTLAVNTMPKEALDGTMSMWDQVVKRTIDIDATKRTNYLESTTVGRAAKIKNEPDGEDFRLFCLKQWEIAKTLITANLRTRTEDISDESF